jgi:hypothetical protein
MMQLNRQLLNTYRYYQSVMEDLLEQLAMLEQQSR